MVVLYFHHPGLPDHLGRDLGQQLALVRHDPDGAVVVKFTYRWILDVRDLHLLQPVIVEPLPHCPENFGILRVGTGGKAQRPLPGLDGLQGQVENCLHGLPHRVRVEGFLAHCQCPV